jgi:tetratricopeptide (TPR) repeat protein
MPEATGSITSYPLLTQAQLLAKEGKFDAAAKVLIEHLRRYPDEARGMALLGQVALRLGALGQAEHFLRGALARGANDRDVRRDLLSVWTQQERPAQALRLVETMLSEGDDPILRGIRANLYEKLGRNDEALEFQAQLTRDKPDFPPAWISYGHYLRAAGRVDEAIAAYRRSTEIDPEFGEAWWGLASIKRPVLDERDIATMRQQRAIAIDVRNSAPLEFALARAHHDRGEYREAFGHYERGNRLRAESLEYDASQLTDEIGDVERIATREFIAAMSDVPYGDERPIFIVSLPRSGSTLLEQMLGSHPQIEPVGELPYIPAILRTFIEMATRRGKVAVTEAIAGISDRQAEAMGRDYLERARLHRKTTRPFFIDKLPQNWSNILFIRRILPQARFIDIRRDAMDCCFSNFTQSFTNAHAASFTLQDVGRNYADNVRLMNHFDAVAPGLVGHVDYAALIDDPKAQIAPLLDQIGLPWDEAILDFHRLDRVVRTPSSEQVRRPLNRDGFDVWRPYAEWLGPLREALGPFARD